MQDQNDKSVWKNNASKSSNPRKQVTAYLGTAKDAYRVLDRHQKEVRRTNNRTMVSSYTGTTDKTDKKMFNAVSSVDRFSDQNSGSTFGERSARPTWHSKRGSGYPLSRNNQRKEKIGILIFALVFIAIIVFLVVAVRGCSG